uniref:Fungal-type protein kinase domain-containing protein n=1 Tax=Ganoderma boninense TaxID=34458 RepID=A0A5K1JW24_9APHY|nr:Uncharacterized protein [Ganoderma boninense]
MMYEDYTKRLNKITHGSGYVFTVTPYKADNATNPKPAVVGMYPPKHMQEKDQAKGLYPGEKKDVRRISWSSIDLLAQCNLEVDPFEDGVGTGRSSRHKRRDASGQILSTVELTFDHQHRTFIFMLIFIGLDCRILRMDRLSLFVTKQFNITTTSFLVQFLRRYVKLSPEARGYDTTAQRIFPGSTLSGMMKERLSDVEKMLEEQKDLESGEGDARLLGIGERDRVEEHVVELWRNALDEKWPWWKLCVPDQATEKDRWFLVGKPSSPKPPGVRGRGTRCYIAVELFESHGEQVLDTKFVHLKDCWRVLDRGADGPAMDIRQEGLTLQKLNGAHVKHVPTLVAHGDINEQSTQTPAAGKSVENQRKHHLKTYRHYRLVVKEIGKPLSEFENSGQLLRVLYDCLRAHRDAMAINIIHRDISGGNILLYKNERGRWRDEIECFFHVLIYYAVRFLHHNIPDELVGLFIENYFYVSSGTTATGELNAPFYKRQAMDFGRIMLESYGVFDHLRFMWVDDEPQGEAQGADPPASSLTPPPPDYDSHPLNDLVETLLSWFHAVYTINFLDGQAAIINASLWGGASPPPGLRRGKPAVAEDSDSEPEREPRSRLPRDSSPDPTRPSPEKEKELRALAAHLDGHTHVVALFRDICHELFPSDKTKDKRPEKGSKSCSPQPSQSFVVSESSEVRLESKDWLDELEGAGARAPRFDGPAPSVNFASLAMNSDLDSDGEPSRRRAPPAAAVPAEDKLEHDNAPHHSPSPGCTNRPKRVREDGVAPSGLLGTFGKRTRY